MTRLAPKSAEPDDSLGAPEMVVHPYADASGQVAFEVVRRIYGKHCELVQHRRPSGEGDGSWLLNLDMGEFMRPAPGENWVYFNPISFEQYPATRQRKFFKAAPAIPYHLPELRKAVADDRVIYIVKDESEVEFFRGLGRCATCCHGYADEWRPKHITFLRDADVVMFLDDDSAAIVADRLAPMARRLRVSKDDTIVDWQKEFAPAAKEEEEEGWLPFKAGLSDETIARLCQIWTKKRDEAKRGTLEEPKPERPTTADIIPFPKRILLDEALTSSTGFAAAVREACEVFAKTGKLGDAALVYGKYNIAVFPCDPVTKVPIPRRDPDPTG